jgi:hypothetical protein
VLDVATSSSISFTLRQEPVSGLPACSLMLLPVSELSKQQKHNQLFDGDVCLCRAVGSFPGLLRRPVDHAGGQAADSSL